MIIPDLYSEFYRDNFTAIGERVMKESSLDVTNARSTFSASL